MRLGRFRLNVDIDSLIQAILLSCQGINLILCAMDPGFEKLGLTFVIAISIALFVVRLNTIFSVNVVLPIALVLFYLITFIQYGNRIAVSWMELVAYVLVPFAFSGLQYDVEKIIKKTLILTSPGILLLDKVFPKTWHGGISMGVSYAFLVPIACAILYMFIYRKNDTMKSRIIYSILCVFNIVYFFQVLTYGSRGPAMSVIIMIITLLLFQYNEETDKLECKGIWLLVFILAGLFVILFYGSSIFPVLNEITQKFGINIRILSKSSVLLQSNNILNNRLGLYTKAIEEFAKEPFWGHGFDMWDANTGLVYPHNLFLQFMYDGGLLLLALIVIPLVLCSKRILLNGNRDEIVCWLFLFMVSVPGAMFSGDIWQKYTFWVFIAYCIAYSKRIRRRSYYENRDINVS